MKDLTCYFNHNKEYSLSKERILYSLYGINHTKETLIKYILYNDSFFIKNKKYFSIDLEDLEYANEEYLFFIKIIFHSKESEVLFRLGY